MDMEFETHVPSGVVAADTRGKHRILAELKRLEQETRSLEEELDELEKTDKVSVACKELLLHIEARPDPLLPVTNGPTNPFWDRWFEGPQDSQGCRCWDAEIRGVEDKMRWNPDPQKDFTVATAYQAAKEDDAQPALPSQDDA